MRPIRSQIPIALTLILAGVLTASRQTSQSSSPERTLKVSTVVVNVPAVVRDKNGRLIADLGQDDFALKEDKRPQEITYFSRQEELPLRGGLLIDTSYSQAHVLPEERTRAKAFIQEVMRPQDSFFIMQFDNKLKVLQDFTDDAQALFRAIDGLDKTAPRTRLLDAVRQASALMQKQQGRKALILLTDGGDTSISRTALKKAVRAALEADVVIYSVATTDPVMYVIPTYALKARSILNELSNQTGGRVIRTHKNQLAEAFQQLSEELRSLYLLGYTPTPRPQPGSFHHLKVSVPQSDFRVRARGGYYAGARE